MYEKLGIMLLDTAKLAFVVGLLFYIIQKSLPPEAVDWYFIKRGWLVNLSVVLASVGLAYLGAWLNLLSFDTSSLIEYFYFGLFSAGMSTLGYEFQKNWRK